MAFFSCNSEFSELSPSEEQAKVSFRSCTTIEPAVEGDPTGRVSYKGSYWMAGQTIRIKFLNGDAYLQNKVKQFANQWLQYSNLKYEWVTGGQSAAIKIGFKWNGDAGSWSYIGNKCYTIAQNSPSMNFGWFDNSTSDEEFSRVVIHEFGHALGFGHEHQNPTSPIQWNVTEVYNYYALAGWDKEKVDNNILNKFSPSTVDYTNFDAQSIMLYSFPSYLTLNGYSFPWNTVLSNEDKASATTLYPQPPASDPFRVKLVSGQSLKSGEYFMTNNYKYVMRMKSDGNLEISENTGKVIWHTKTYGNPGAYAVMQTDGNFVVRTISGAILWSTGTTGKIGAYIYLEFSGDLRLNNYLGQNIWSSKAGLSNSPFI